MFLFLIYQSLLRTAEQLKIKGLCEVSESQYEQEYSPSIKRYKPYRSRSPENRFPSVQGSQSNTCTRSNNSSSSQSNTNQSGQDSKSDHKSSSRSHTINSESASIDNGSSVVVLESRDLTPSSGKEGKGKMTSLGMGVGIVSKLSNVVGILRTSSELMNLFPFCRTAPLWVCQWVIWILLRNPRHRQRPL